MIRIIPPLTIDFLAGPEVENCILHPYNTDGAGVWTFGVGHKIKAGELYPYVSQGAVQQWHLGMSDPGVKNWVPQPKQRAIDLCYSDLFVAASAVNKWILNLAKYNDNQYAAMIILAFNIGAGAFAGSDTVEEFNKGNVPKGLAAWLTWNKVTNPVTRVKEVSKGLTKRRTMEVSLFQRAA